MPEAFISALVRMGVCVFAYAALRSRSVVKAAGLGEVIVVAVLSTSQEGLDRSLGSSRVGFVNPGRFVLGRSLYIVSSQNRTMWLYKVSNASRPRLRIPYHLQGRLSSKIGFC
jgi:hypothetical protein